MEIFIKYNTSLFTSSFYYKFYILFEKNNVYLWMKMRKIKIYYTTNLYNMYDICKI